MTLHISLPKELENKVHQQVDTGMYQSASEVVREALRDFFSKPSINEVYELMFAEAIEEFESGKAIIDNDTEEFLKDSKKYLK